MHNFEIGEIARRGGVQTSTIRFYERLRLLSKPMRVNGRRRYELADLRQLRAIRVAQEAGFTLAEIATLFGGFSKDVPISTQWREAAERKLTELDARIAQVERMKLIIEEGMRCDCIRVEDCLLLLDGPAKEESLPNPM